MGALRLKVSCGLLVVLVMAGGCASAPHRMTTLMPPAPAARPLPSPPGGGCLPFESLVPPGVRPETARVADILFRSGYVIVGIEGGRVIWRCSRAHMMPVPPNRKRPAPKILPPPPARRSPAVPRHIEFLPPGGHDDESRF